MLLTGQFDQVNFIDEASGKQEYIYANLFPEGTESGLVFQCNEDLFECDYWKTSMFDVENHLLYFQIHNIDSLGNHNTAVAKVGFSQSKVNAQWYPYLNVVESMMNFGYSGYQHVLMVQ